MGFTGSGAAFEIFTTSTASPEPDTVGLFLLGAAAFERPSAVSASVVPFPRSFSEGARTARHLTVVSVPFLF